MSQPMKTTVRLLGCALLIGLIGACDRGSDGSNVIVLPRPAGPGLALGGTGYLYVVVDPEVLPARTTRDVMEETSKAFASAGLALVEPAALPLLNPGVAHQTYFVGRSHSVAGKQDGAFILLFPSGKPPEAAMNAGVVAVLHSAAADFASWKTWCAKNGVPYVEAKSRSATDVRDAIAAVNRLPSEIRDRGGHR